jgi:hypothetical protein
MAGKKNLRFFLRPDKYQALKICQVFFLKIAEIILFKYTCNLYTQMVIFSIKLFDKEANLLCRI